MHFAFADVEKVRDVYSPGMLSPQAIKKPRKNTSAPNVSAAGAALQAASKGKPKAALSKVSRRIMDSDDEETGDEGGQEVVVKTPKPVRQRAQKSYVLESEVESEEEESEYESD